MHPLLHTLLIMIGICALVALLLLAYVGAAYTVARLWQRYAPPDLGDEHTCLGRPSTLRDTAVHPRPRLHNS